MPTSVKDLVRLYESSPTKRLSGLSDTVTPTESGSEALSSVDTKVDDCVTNPARFLYHPRDNVRDQDGIITRRRSRTFSPATPDLASTTIPLDTPPSTTTKNGTSPSPFKCDGMQSSSHDIHWSQLRYARCARTKNRHSDQREDDEEVLLQHTYPPSTYNKIIHAGGNAPVPATTLFARKAAPLYLPHLDDHLSRLPRPHFVQTHPQGQSKVSMFRPMEQLEKFGKSLDDLEVNSTAAPFWRNRKTILGSAINAIIGILVREVSALSSSNQSYICRDPALWLPFTAYRVFSIQFKFSP